MIADKGVILPTRATKMSAGYDFYAPKDIELTPGRWTLIDTGIRFDGKEKVSVPAPGRNGKQTYNRWFMMLAPKSGLGTKYGVRLANTMGIIDQDYPQNILVQLTADQHIIIEKDKKFIQGIVIPYGIFEEESKPTAKRTGGHGSTGE